MDLSIKQTKTEKDYLINLVIDVEWEMFDKVEGIDGRACCQNDPEAFYIMRYSQYAAFTTKTIKSYYADLLDAKDMGRNLLTEKYAYMMKATDEDYYIRELEKSLPRISPQKNMLIQKISEEIINQEKVFVNNNPEFAAKGRPVIDSNDELVSAKDYLEGELKTYSTRTLKLLLNSIRDKQMKEHEIENDMGFVEQIHCNMIELSEKKQHLT